jgi:rhodanese-related sulfurtransferase
MVAHLLSPLRSLAWKGLNAFLRQKFPDVKWLSTAELANWLTQHDRPQPVLFDVRTPQEYEVSHLAQAHLAPTDPQALQNWQGLSHSTPIVTYCSVGYRSAKFAQQLQAMGYQTVFNLEGSIFQWANEGRSLDRTPQTTQPIHPYNNLWGLLLNPTIPKTTTQLNDDNDRGAKPCLPTEDQEQATNRL